MTLQLSMYSTYRPAEPNLLRQIGLVRSRRQFDLASGVWRELPRKRMRLRWHVALLASAAAVLWLAAGHKPVYIKAALAPVAGRDVPVYMETNATVQAYQMVTVHAQMDGQLSEILFKEGEDVKAGDVLARLDPRTLKMQYDEAMAEKAQDEAMVMKIKNDMAKLRHSGHKRPVSKEAAKKLDELRTELRQFQATVQSDQVTIDTLKNQLSRSVIVAPIDGRTGIRQMDVGNIVHTADANGLVSITQIEPISVVFDLPEKNLLPVRERLNRKEAIPVLAVDNHNKAVLDEGTLELVDSQIDAIHGTVHLKARFPNHKRLLWPGGSVHIKLLVSHLNGALVVPASAVHMENAQSGKKPWVFVYVSADRKLEMRPVKVSMVQDGNAVIEEGVHAGEQVVTDSQGLLAGGNYLIAQGQPPAQ